MLEGCDSYRSNRFTSAQIPETAAVSPPNRNKRAKSPAMKDLVSGSNVSGHMPNRKNDAAAMVADHLNTFAARFVRPTGSGVCDGSSGVARLAGLPSCARGD